MVLVLAAGVGGRRCAKCSRSLGLSVDPLPREWPPVLCVWASGQVPVERTAGVVLEIVAVFLLVVLARTLIGVFRGATGSAGSTGASHSIVGLRLAQRGQPVFCSGSSRQSRKCCESISRREAEISTWVPGWASIYHVHQSLLPACGLFAILGLVLGSGAEFLLPAAPRRRRRPYWLFVVLAGVAAVLIAASNAVGALIASLVLVALEAVNNAMHHAATRGPGLWTRCCTRESTPPSPPPCAWRWRWPWRETSRCCAAAILLRPAAPAECCACCCSPAQQVRDCISWP